MAAADPRLRQIKIKTGVVKRLGKEKSAYEKEAEKLKEKVEQMKVDKKDEYDIKKQTEVHQESEMMIPDCTRRLKTAFQELESMMETENDLNETEEYKAAKAMLEENRAAVST